MLRYWKDPDESFGCGFQCSGGRLNTEPGTLKPKPSILNPELHATQLGASPGFTWLLLKFPHDPTSTLNLGNYGAIVYKGYHKQRNPLLRAPEA